MQTVMIDSLGHRTTHRIVTSPDVPDMQVLVPKGAALAKGGSILASSGARASQFRAALKVRFGGKETLRKPNLAKYPTDEALRAGAGRTNKFLNAYAVGITVSGARAGSGCGCRN